jgi:uncharacterized protein YbaA (DUF1428 family)
MTYISGFVLAVPTKNKEAYAEMARKVWPTFKKVGALRMVEGWGVDVPHGKQTDFFRAVQASEDETPMFSFIEWPDKETCDAGTAQMEAEMEGVEMPEMPFDGKRMFWGGFTPLLDERA